FPFANAADCAHAVAAALLPFVRDLIPGATPLHLIDKPTAGTGAALLAFAITFPAVGRPVAVMTEGRDEDEWRERLTAVPVSGVPVVVLDNVRRRLDSAALSAALTAEAWTDRLLGRSEMARMPVRCLWLATGNNVALSMELARRTVRLRLDARMDRPWLRP